MFTPQQNSRIRRQIAKELDHIDSFINAQVAPHVPIAVYERLQRKLGEFGDFLLDTDIRYYEEDEIAPISKAAKVQAKKRKEVKGTVAKRYVPKKSQQRRVPKEMAWTPTGIRSRWQCQSSLTP